MKWSFTNVGLLIFGFFGILAITFFNELTVSNEQDYYTLKDAVEAAMIDSVDITYFRLTGSIKINQEKFVELLTRRFSEVATYGEGNYDLEFYQISESPPKVSVRVVDATNSYNIFGTFGTDPTKVNIVNEITAIMDVYEDGDINKKPIMNFMPNEIDFSPLGIKNNPAKNVFQYGDDYYDLPDGVKVSDLKECELYDDKIKCMTEDGHEIIFEQINEDNSCVKKDGQVECKNMNGETIIIVSNSDNPADNPEENNPADNPEENNPADNPEENNPGDDDVDEPESGDKTINVQVIKYLNYEYESFKLIPKYNHYLKYNGEYYVPVGLNGPILNDSRICKKKGLDISCLYNGNTYVYKKSSITALSCFKYSNNGNKVYDDYYLLNSVNDIGFLNIGVLYEETTTSRKISYFINDKKKVNLSVPCYYSNDSFSRFGHSSKGGLFSYCYTFNTGVGSRSNTYTIGIKNDTVCGN